jgi:hypothetical protein
VWGSGRACDRFKMGDGGIEGRMESDRVPRRVARRVIDFDKIEKFGYALLESACAITAQDEEASNALDNSALDMDHGSLEVN